MSNIQEQVDPPPPSSHQVHRRSFLFLAVAFFTLVVAMIWALSDIGWVDGTWGKLAVIYFTCLALWIATWPLLRGKE